MSSRIRTSSRFRATLVAAVLFASLAGGAFLVTAAAPAAGESAFDVRRALPADPIFHLSIDGRTAREGWDGLALARLMDEEQMKAFVEPIVAQIDGMFQEAMVEIEQQVGLKSDELEQLVSASMTMTLAHLDMGDGSGPPDVDMVMTFDLEENPELLQKVAGIIEKTMREEMQVEPLRGELAGVPVWTTNMDGIDVIWGTVDRHLVAGTKTATMADVLGRLKAQTATGGLFSTEATKAALSRTVPSGRSVAFVYADVPRIKSLVVDSGMADEMPVQPICDLLGIDAMRSISYGMSFEGKAIVDRFFVHAPKGLTGIYADFKGSEAPWRTLAMAPASSLFYEGFRVDVRSMADRLVRAAHEIDQDTGSEVDRMLVDFEQKFGFTLIEDFLGTIGQEMAIWMGGSPYGGMVPELVLAIEIKDREAFERRVDAMLASIDQPRAVRRFRFMDRDFRYLDTARFSNEDIDFGLGLKPTMTIHDGFCLLALAPQTLKNFVVSRSGQRVGLDADADLKNGLAQLRGRHPAAGNAAVLYMDLGDVATWAIDTMVPIAQSVDMPEEMPIDMALFPTSDIFRKHLFGITGASTVGADGVTSEIHSPVGYMTFFGAVMGVGAVAVMRDASVDAESGWEEWELEEGGWDEMEGEEWVEPSDDLGEEMIEEAENLEEAVEEVEEVR